MDRSIHTASFVGLLALLSGAAPLSAQTVIDLVSDVPEVAEVIEAADTSDSEAATLTGLDWFFERKPLGFELESIERVQWRFGHFVEDVAQGFGEWMAEPLGDRLDDATLLLSALLLLFAVWWLDRKMIRRVDAATERLGLRGHKHARDVSVAFLRVLSRMVYPGALLVLTYVPLRGLTGDAPWVWVSSRLIVLWMLYRAGTALTRQLVIPRVVEMTDRHAKLCRDTIVWAIRAFILFRGLRALMLGLGADVFEVAFIDFALRLALTVVALRLLFIKSAVLDLLPPVGPTVYLRFRRLLDRFYVPLSVVTTVLLAMWTFGWERASLAILWRVYASLLIFVVGSLSLRRFIAWQDAKRAADASDFRLLERVLFDVSGYLKILGLLLMFVLATAVLGLWGVFTTVVEWPWFKLGDVHVSLATFTDSAVVLVIFLFISRLLRSFLEHRVAQQLELEEGLAYAASSAIHYLFLAVGVLAALLTTGVDLTALGVFFGALGVGIGLGLQQIVRDVVAGFILLFGRAVEKGDFVEIADGVAGAVSRVGVRSVTVKTRDDQELLVPTSVLINGTITNFSHTSPLVRVAISVGVSYEADPRRVREALLAAASECPGVLKAREPLVWIDRFGDSSVDYDLLVWIDVKRTGMRQLRGELYFIIWDKLKEAGIEIPFPQRDLHIKSLEPDLPPLALATGARGA